MFVQVIKGRTGDAASVLRQNDRWIAEVRPGAIGFLGATFGVADDGTVFAIARFEDEAAAKTNADRPEQTAWWNEMVKYVDGELSVRESSDIGVLFDGGSDQAGFVQVMEGVVKDRAKAEAFETTEMMEQLRKARPDLIGSVRAWFGGGAYVDVAYFTSEADARTGESSGDFSGPQQSYADLFGDMTFLDLHNPRFASPG